MSKRSAEDSLENILQKQRMDVSGISNAKNVQLFRYAKRVKLPRKVNKGLFRAAQLKQAAYNKARSAQTAAEVAATEPMEWDGDGAYRRKRRSYKKRRTFRGRGGYLGNQAGSWLANAAMAHPYGAALRPWAPAISSMAGSAGSWLEDTGLSAARRFMGRGAYGANQLITDMGDYQSPNFSSAGDETGDLLITKREYIGDVLSTGTISFTTPYFLTLNPGLAATFPWLSNIAQYFEEYEFKQLIFEYKSMISAGNQNSGGTVSTVTLYNPTSTAFTNKQALEQYDYSTSCKAEESCYSGVECDPNKRGGNTFEYIRTGTVPTGQDPKTFDMGTFQLSLSGVPTGYSAGTILGELWVNYTVRLSKAKFSNATTVSILNNASYQQTAPLNAGTIASLLSGVTSAASAIPVNTLSVALLPAATYGNNSLGIKWFNTGGNVNLVIPAAVASLGSNTFRLTYSSSSNDCTAAGSMDCVASTNCTRNTNAIVADNAATGSTQTSRTLSFSAMFTFTNTASDCVIVCSMLGQTNVNKFTVFVTPVAAF